MSACEVGNVPWWMFTMSLERGTQSCPWPETNPPDRNADGSSCAYWDTWQANLFAEDVPCRS